MEKIEFSSPALVWVGKVEEDSTVGALKEANGLTAEYSAELTEEEIAGINARTAEAGDWALISLKPFTTEETLTVTMKDGGVFTILVTDDQATDPYGINNDVYVITTSDKNWSLKAQETGFNGFTVMQAQHPSGDTINQWSFEYDSDAFDGRGGYYLKSVLNDRYLSVDADQNLTFADVKYAADGEDGQKAASPFAVMYNEKKNLYRFSTDPDSQRGFLTYAAGNPGVFGVRNEKNDDTTLFSLRDPDNPVNVPGTVGTWDIKADGITLKLFNYDGMMAEYNNYSRRWGDTKNHIDDKNQWAPDDLDKLRQGSGINKDRSLLFSGSGINKDTEAWNQFTLTLWRTITGSIIRATAPTSTPSGRKKPPAGR